MLISVIVFSVNFHAQETLLDNLLKMAEKSSRNYVESFKNLIAEEIKTIETFKKDQSLDKRRIVKSNFIVYQLQNGEQISEFRSVLEYNGKPVSQSDAEVEKFFQKLAKSNNKDEAFRRIKKESVRYDGNFVVWGMTLSKDFLVQEKVRKIFDYKIIGREKFAERDVYVVEYRQKEYSPLVLVNATDEELKMETKSVRFDTVISDKLKPTNPRLNGKMWIDVKTGEIWKNEYQVMIQPKILDKPILANESYYEYQPSKFKIAVPKTIVITSYRTFGEPGKNLIVAKFASTTLNYSKFNELNSEAKNYKIDEN